jgi:hypothetical protein
MVKKFQLIVFWALPEKFGHQFSVAIVNDQNFPIAQFGNLNFLVTQVGNQKILGINKFFFNHWINGHCGLDN